MKALRKEKRAGEFVLTAVGGEQVRAYLPPPLPPEPSLNLEKLYGLMEDANRSLGRPAASALRVHQYLQSKPILSVPGATKALGLTAPTVRKSVEHLLDLGIAREITGKKRGKLFVYNDYLNLLNEGTEPLR